MKKKLLVLALPIFAALTLTSCNILPDMHIGGDDNTTSQTSSDSGSGSDSSSSSSSPSSSSSSSSSTQTVVLSSITLGTKKTTYNAGDSFVKPIVTAHYSNGSTKAVTNLATFTGFNSSTATNSQTITVSYTEGGVTKTTSYTIKIVAVLTSITVSGQKTEYEVGDSFVKPTVTAHYNGASSKTVTSSATFTGFNSSVVSTDQVITVSYTENSVTKTTTYKVNIKAKENPDDTIVSNKSMAVHAGESYTKNITVYFSDQTVDIPYVQFNDFYSNVYTWVNGGYTLAKSNPSTGVYRYTASSGVYFEVNCSSDLITVSQPIYLMCFLDKYNETVPTIADGYETAYCEINNKTSLLANPNSSITFDLGAYGIDIINYSNNAYVPLMTMVDMFISSLGGQGAYNGEGLYLKGFYSNDTNFNSGFYNNSPWLNQSTRSQTLAAYTYKELCFNIDHFYGLKATRGINKIDTIIQTGGYKNNLLSTNTQTYETAMQQFVGDYFYDGHSGYTLASPFQKDLGTSTYSNARDNNEREISLMSAYYQCSYGRSSAGKGVGLTFSSDNNTAVIRFDSFVKAKSTSSYNVDNYTYAQLHDMCSYLFFKKAFEEITAKGSAVKKVVIDVSCNGGGMVDSLPFLLGFMTDDPVITFKDTLLGSVSDIHYSVDLNQDGTKGGTGDTYKGQYDFYILTSNFSFSCGNAFPTFAKNGGMAKIIGQQSGGGACAVGGFATASGTLLRSSSCWQFGKYSGGTWTDNDGGVPVDYSFPVSSFYDDDAINTFVKSH